jgi:hypothetical protein
MSSAKRSQGLPSGKIVHRGAWRFGLNQREKGWEQRHLSLHVCARHPVYPSPSAWIGVASTPFAIGAMVFSGHRPFVLLVNSRNLIDFSSCMNSWLLTITLWFARAWC